MSEHSSPEEKLLKLIRRKDRQPAHEAVMGMQKSPQGVVAIKSPIEFGRPKTFLNFLDKIFMVIIIFLVAYLSYELFISGGQKELNLKDKELSSNEMVTGESLDVSPKPYTYYTGVVETRDIFESPIYGNKKAEDIKTVASLPELTKNLKLVGIILDKNAEAVIEDLEAGETLFLHKGEQIKNAVVDEIQENKVILLYGDKKIELAQ